MALIYVNGTPGSGKSAVNQKLKDLGFESHDVDDPDMGGPYKISTNERVDYPDNPTEEWFDHHKYLLIPEAVKELHDRAKNKTIFLCGTADNEEALWSLFDQVKFLDTTWDLVQERIAQRKGNDYGKASHELLLIKKKHDEYQENKNRPGTTVIDASLPLDEVVNLVVGQSTK